MKSINDKDLEKTTGGVNFSKPVFDPGDGYIGGSGSWEGAQYMEIPDPSLPCFRNLFNKPCKLCEFYYSSPDRNYCKFDE